MNCEEAKKLVHAYVDRELDLAKSLEFERHLTDCDSCSKEHASLQALRSSVSSLYQKPSAQLQDRVISAIRKDAKSEAQPHVLPWRWVGVAASLVLLLFLSW